MVDPQLPLRQPLQLSLSGDYRSICNLLLSLTHTLSLPKGLQRHTYIIKTGLLTLPVLSHQLINFYSKTQLPFSSLQLFNDSPHKSATTWSSLISSFAQNDLPLDALHSFRRMLRHGLLPDDHIFPSATKSCAILSLLNVGQSVHCFAVKTAYHFDVFVGSSIVDMYAKCGEIKYAREVFDEMPHRNVVSWSGMIYGYVQTGEDEEALKLFKRVLVEENVGVNDFTLSSVLRVCAASTLFQLGKFMHGLCFKLSFDSSCFVAVEPRANIPCFE